MFGDENPVACGCLPITRSRLVQPEGGAGPAREGDRPAQVRGRELTTGTRPSASYRGKRGSAGSPSGLGGVSRTATQHQRRRARIAVSSRGPAGQVPRRPGPRPGQPAGVSRTSLAQVRTGLQGISHAERNWSDQVLGALPARLSLPPRRQLHQELAMHAADILAGVHGVPVAPACRGSSGLPRGPGNARPAPGRSSGTGAAPAVERRYRVLERACVTAPVYPAGQDPGRDILAGPGFPKLRRAAKQRSGSVTVPGPVRQRPAGWSPFAGVARIRSLGVAVQP